MSADPDRIPKDRRQKIDELVQRDQAPRAIELLEMWTTQFTITPWAMQRLGELYLAQGDRTAAGRAFFWSGDRSDPAQQACIDEFLASLRRRPRRIVDSLPPRARVPRDHMPGALPEELLRLRVTDSVVKQRNRATPLHRELLVLLPVLFVFVVGLITVGRWLLAAARDLF